MIKLLLKNGAKIDKPCTLGNTPLLELIIRERYPNRERNGINYERILKFYLKYANANAVSHDGHNVLWYGKREAGWKVILEHMAKLQALNLPVHPKITDTISEIKEFSAYFEMCKVELTKAKSTKLHDCWVTYFNLLVDSKKKLKNYAGNKDLVEDFQKTDCVLKFPIYGHFIRKNVNKAVERRKLFDESTDILSGNLIIFNPSHLIINDILDCLKMKDYSKLCEKNQK